MNRSSLGPLVKAKETVSVFVRNAPSPRELLANRTSRFGRLHAVVPSTATPGESLTLTVQAWDQCERLHRDFAGSAAMASTDPEATHPESVSFASGDDGVVRVDDVRFETPGTQYLTLTDARTGERFVSNPVRVADDHDHRVYWGDIHLHSNCSDGVGDANGATDSAGT
ncbi:hypothetical protein [Halogeometricum sp. CBA1124]|uniref:hypothetical protein n=1 Tax=Halogeometricum sp. CBA1124 TaxID=2668071 RepID=UPI001E470049|nr:hypothetical protein [Halogeometricum sp. CBA1124]